jgi:hypothetical protein
MTRRKPYVLRYRRTENTRGDDWKPLGSTWQTAASEAVVAHDVYHHMPGDTGTLAEEMATFGAEYYVNYEHSGERRAIPLLELGAVAVATEAATTARQPDRACVLTSPLRRPLDTNAEEAFSCVAQAAFFQLEAALEVRREDELARGMVSAIPEIRGKTFVASAVNLMRFGYRQARRRFPDQQRVRTAMSNLELVLRSLGRDMVPAGHDITLTLTGYDCRVDYADADAEVMTGLRYIPAWMMSWSRMDASWGSEGVSLHQSTGVFREYIEDLTEEALASTSASDVTLPDGDARHLQQVYVTDASLIERIRNQESARVEHHAMPRIDYTPRGIQVIGGLG